MITVSQLTWMACITCNVIFFLVQGDEGLIPSVIVVDVAKGRTCFRPLSTSDMGVVSFFLSINFYVATCGERKCQSKSS